MNVDLELLYKTVDKLNPHQRAKLIDYLTTGQREAVPVIESVNEWQFDLAHDVIQTSPDFDEPLPDEFWLGKT